jgi:hypothetical protein
LTSPAAKAEGWSESSKVRAASAAMTFFKLVASNHHNGRTEKPAACISASANGHNKVPFGPKTNGRKGRVSRFRQKRKPLPRSDLPETCFPARSDRLVSLCPFHIPDLAGEAAARYSICPPLSYHSPAFMSSDFTIRGAGAAQIDEEALSARGCHS